MERKRLRVLDVSRPRLDVVARNAVATAIGGFAMVAVVAARMTPPAGAIADRYATLAAILIAATVLTVLVTMHDRLDRLGRLAAVVILAVTGMGWHNGRLWV